MYLGIEARLFEALYEPIRTRFNVGLKLRIGGYGRKPKKLDQTIYVVGHRSFLFAECNDVVSLDIFPCRPALETATRARTFSGRSSSFVRRPLDSLLTDFVGPNPNGFVDIVHKYFAVSDFASLR